MNDNYFTGAVPDMPNPVYHNQPHIGSSGFKLLARSPAHYWSAYVDPDRERREPTPLMLIGTAWHTGIFEPELFEGSYAAKPDIHPLTIKAKLLYQALEDIDAFQASHVAIPDGLGKTTKEGKALLAELAEQGKTGVEAAVLAEILELIPPLLGKTLLNADDLDAVTSMASAARRHPVSQIIFGLPGGHAETSIFWVDPDTGAPCRIRPDYHVEPCAMFPHGLIIDGKSNDDSSPAGFARSAMNSEMFYQAAFYSDGFQAHYKTKEPPVFAWLAQERDAPFATAYYSAGSDFVQYGRKKYRALLRTFAHCLQTGVWPGYPTTVQPLDLPGWAIKAIEGEVAA